MHNLRLMAAGDIWLQTISGRHPFEEILHVFQDKDLLFGNLETTLSETGERAEKHHVISTSPKAAQYLVDAGFDLISVANNHSTDLGLEGFTNTLAALESRGIQPVGGSVTEDRQDPVIIERGGVSIGFIGYTTGRLPAAPGFVVNRLVEDDIMADIAAIKGRCDHVAISLHWGTEMAYYPSPGQIRLARRLIDAGATLILGHHSHTMQAIERYRGGLIAYSLGMLQFDPHWPHNLSQEAFVLSVDLKRDGVIGEYEVIPVMIDDDYMPHPVEGATAERIRAFIDDLSNSVSKGEITWSRWFEEVAPVYMRMNLESYRYRIGRGEVFPLLEMAVWLCTPFCLGCYVGLMRRQIRQILLQDQRSSGSGGNPEG